MRNPKFGWSLVVAVAISWVPAGAQAGGIYAGESGSAAQSRGGAFVARADDPTALAINPAGLAKTKSKAFYVGANTVFFHQSFKRAGTWQTWPDAAAGEQPFAGAEYPEISNDGPPQPVPTLAYAQRFGQFVVAVGVIAPQGYPNREYPKTVDVAGATTEATPHRYDVVTQTSIAALPSVAVAYPVTPQLDIGLRASVGFGSLSAESYTWGIVNGIEDVEQDGLFIVDVKDNFIPAFGIGALFRPSDSLEIGFAWNSAIKMNAKGTGAAILGDRLSVGTPPVDTIIVPQDDQFAQCEPGGTQESLKACVNLTIPQTVAVGARWIFRDGAGQEKADVELDLRWENWAAASDIEVLVDGRSAQDTDPIIFVRDLEKAFLRHGFKDVFVVRVGGQMAIGSRVVVRGGLSYDTAAAPVSWTRLDIDGTERYQAAAGVGITFGKLRLDLGGAAIISPSRTVDEAAISPTPTDNSVFNQPNPVQPLEGPLNQKYDPINNGVFKSGYFIIATGVTMAF